MGADTNVKVLRFSQLRAVFRQAVVRVMLNYGVLVCIDIHLKSLRSALQLAGKS